MDIIGLIGLKRYQVPTTTRRCQQMSHTTRAACSALALWPAGNADIRLSRIASPAGTSFYITICLGSHSLYSESVRVPRSTGTLTSTPVPQRLQAPLRTD